MLYLTRGLQESIIINGNTEIKVVSVNRNTVKLAINSPRSVPVLRKEIYNSVVRANRNSSCNLGENGNSQTQQEQVQEQHVSATGHIEGDSNNSQGYQSEDHQRESYKKGRYQNEQQVSVDDMVDAFANITLPK